MWSTSRREGRRPWLGGRGSRWLGVAAVAGALLTCATVTPSGDPADEGDSLAPVSFVVRGEPRTFEVALEPAVRERLLAELERGSLEVARLFLRDLRFRGAERLKGVHVFVEKPDADRSTPVDDPHYVQSFALGLEPTQSMAWNIAPVLTRLWHAGKLSRLLERAILRVTLVPQPWDPHLGVGDDLELELTRLEIELETPPDQL